jgi:hypothetical protein
MNSESVRMLAPLRWMDHAALAVVVLASAGLAVELALAEPLVDAGVVDVAAGEVVESELVPVGRESVVIAVEVDSPPVIVEPVIGIGVVIGVSDVAEAEVVGEAGTEMFVMEKSGLVLPESPNTTHSL